MILRRLIIPMLASSFVARYFNVHLSGGTPSATATSRLGESWWRARHEAILRQLATGAPVDLVLLGDSITQNWNDPGFGPTWERFYAGRRVLNLGFKGDTTAHLLWRIENGELAGIAPRAAVLLIGANNFGHLHASASDTVEGIAAVIGAVHQRLPKTRILLVGVLPSIRNRWVDAQTHATNEALSIRYDGGADPLVTWLDLTRLFLDGSGHVDRTRFYDIHLVPPEPPLHPDPETQGRMAAAMEPYLSRWLGDRSRA